MASLGTATLELTTDNARLASGLLSAKTVSEGAFAGIMAAAKRMAVTLGVAFGAKEIFDFGKSSVEAAMEFEKSMTMIHTQAGASTEAVKAMSKSILDMAAGVGMKPDELAQGMYHLASQGLKGKEAMDALRVAAEGAKIGNANLEDVTNALGAALASGIKGVSNLDQAMGMMNATVGAGDMRMQDLADAFGTGLPSKAAIFGVSLQDIDAALAVFGDNNIRGAEAGTILASAIRLMGAESGPARDALKGIGLTSTQLAEDMRSPAGMVGAITDLKTHMEDAGLSATEQGQLLTAAFGGKQAGGIMILVDQLDRMKTKEGEVGDGAQKFGDAWDATTKTAQFNTDQFHAAVSTLKIELGEKLLPVVTDVTAKLTELIVWLTNGASVTDHLRDVMDKLGLSATTQRVVLKDLQAAWAGIQQVISETSDIVRTAAVDVYNAIRDNWGKIGPIVHDVGQVLKDTAKVMIDSLKVVTDLLHGNWSKAWQDAKQMVVDALHQVEDVLRLAVDVVKTLAVAIGTAIYEGLHGALRALGVMVGQAFDAVGAALSAEAGKVPGQAETVGLAVVKGVLLGLSVLPTLVLAALSQLAGVIGQIAGEVAGWAVSIGVSLISGIISGLGNLAGNVAGAVKGGISSGIHAAGGLLHGSGEFEFTNKAVGEPLAKGTIDGWMSGIAALAGAARDSLTQTFHGILPAIELASGVLGEKATMAMIKSYSKPDIWAGLPSDLADQMQHAMAITQDSSQIQAATDRLGASAVQKLIDSFNGKQPTLRQELAQTLADAEKQADQDAADRIKAARSAFVDALGNVGSDAVDALNKAFDNVENPFQKQLDANRLAEDSARYHDAVTDAAKKVAEDQQAIVDAAAALAAAADDDAKQKALDAQQKANDQLLSDQKSYTDAQQSLTDWQLQQKADKWDASNKAQQTAQTAHLSALLGQLKSELPKQVEEWVKSHTDANGDMDTFSAKSFLQHDTLLSTLLDKIQKGLAEHPKVWASVYDEILGKLNGYADKFHDAGAALVQSVADGIKGAYSIGQDAIDGFAQMLSNHLPHSPAKVGPLSVMPNWEGYLLSGLAGVEGSGAAGSFAGAVANGLGGGGSSGGGDIVIQVDGETLARINRKHMNRAARSGATLFPAAVTAR